MQRDVQQNNLKRNERSPARRRAQRRPVDDAMTLLEQGYRYAAELEASPWRFAVDLEELLHVGVTRSDLRWLHAKGLVQCGIDVTGPDDAGRHVRDLAGVTFVRSTCFILTREGFVTVDGSRELQLISPTQAGHAGPGGLAEPHWPIDSERLESGSGSLCSPPVISSETGDVEFKSRPDVRAQAATTPSWDPDAGVLSMASRIVKKLNCPAENQRLILGEFERRGWPSRIEDPLPAVPSIGPKRRLHDAIRALNRGHRFAILRFHGDGRGLGVNWLRCGDRPDAAT